MLALNGKESDVDAFPFVLAEKLHKTVAEIRALPRSEVMGWIAYLKVRNAQREAQGG